MGKTYTRADVAAAIASGGADGKLRLSVVIEGPQAQVVRAALEEFGVVKGDFRAFVRRAITAELERMYDERDAQEAAAGAVEAAQVIVHDDARKQVEVVAKVKATASK